MLSHYDTYDYLMPSHNEPMVEKQLLKQILDTVMVIAEGGGE